MVPLCSEDKRKKKKKTKTCSEGLRQPGRDNGKDAISSWKSLSWSLLLPPASTVRRLPQAADFPRRGFDWRSRIRGACMARQLPPALPLEPQGCGSCSLSFQSLLRLNWHSVIASGQSLMSFDISIRTWPHHHNQGCEHHPHGWMDGTYIHCAQKFPSAPW